MKYSNTFTYTQITIGFYLCRITINIHTNIYRFYLNNICNSLFVNMIHCIYRFNKYFLFLLQMMKKILGRQTQKQPMTALQVM